MVRTYTQITLHTAARRQRLPKANAKSNNSVCMYNNWQNLENPSESEKRIKSDVLHDRVSSMDVLMAYVDALRLELRIVQFTRSTHGIYPYKHVTISKGERS